MAARIAKKILLLLGLTALASAADARLQKTIYRSGITLVISNEEMKDITKIINPFKIQKFYRMESVKQLKKNKRMKRWISRYVVRYFRC